MKPILYEANETNFNHRGLGALNEVVEYKVEEELNGQFELFLEYPVSGHLYEKIEDSMLIKAKPNRKDEPHLFRIYEHEMDIATQTVLIYARTNTFDLAGNMVVDMHVNDETPQQAMNRLKSNLIEPTDFTFYSDITTRSSTRWTRRNALNCIAGEQGSLLQYWGGEIKHGNRWIWLYRRRGNDNVTTIRHGKDLDGLRATYSIKGLVTAVLPYYVNRGEDGSEETIVGEVVTSQHINKYPITYYDAVEFTEDDGVTDEESLNRVAGRYFENNTGKDLPSVNMQVSLVDLSHTDEYEKFKGLEEVELGDTLTVYAKKYNVNLTAKVTKVVYNGLTDENEELEIGTTRSRTYDDYRELIDRTVEPVRERINIVQIAANGKNKIFRGPEEPTSGMSGNDLWYKPVGDGEIELYTFINGVWRLEKVSAGLLAGDLDAENGDVNLINVNVHSLVGNTSEFVRSSWNAALGESTYIDGNEIRSTGADGEEISIGSGALNFYNRDGQHLVWMEPTYSDKYPGEVGFGINLRHNRQFNIIRRKTTAPDEVIMQINPLDEHVTFLNDVTVGRLRVKGTNQYLLSRPEGGVSLIDSHAVRLGIGRPDNWRDVFTVNENYNADLYDRLRMNDNTIADAADVEVNSHVYIRRSRASSYYARLQYRYNNEFNIFANGGLLLGEIYNNQWERIMALQHGGINAYRDINMQGNTITNQSDIRLKDNITDTKVSGIEETKRLRMVEFDWKKNHPRTEGYPDERQFGMIAQETPFLSKMPNDNDHYLTIDLAKQTNLNTLTNQELIARVEELERRLDGKADGTTT